MLAAIVAVIIVKGGWEAAASGLGVVAASVLLGCLLVMLAREDGAPARRRPHPG
jgi:hypothetical protein